MKSRQTVSRELRRLNGMLARRNPELSPDQATRLRNYRDALGWVNDTKSRWMPSTRVNGVQPRSGER